MQLSWSCFHPRAAPACRRSPNACSWSGICSLHHAPLPVLLLFSFPPLPLCTSPKYLSHRFLYQSGCGSSCAPCMYHVLYPPPTSSVLPVQPGLLGPGAGGPSAWDLGPGALGLDFPPAQKRGPSVLSGNEGRAAIALLIISSHLISARAGVSRGSDLVPGLAMLWLRRHRIDHVDHPSIHPPLTARRLSFAFKTGGVCMGMASAHSPKFSVLWSPVKESPRSLRLP